MGFTHNIFLAYGIADCLGVFALHLHFRGYFLKCCSWYAWIVLCTSADTVFFRAARIYADDVYGAAYYIIKVLIPIMLIDILLKIRLGIPVRRYLHILITYFAAVYLTALSCGLYLLICGLFPIIL